VHIEHDNSGLRKSWLLDRIEVKNMQTGRTVVFPCNKWLARDKEDGEIARDLLPLNDKSESRESSRQKRYDYDYERLKGDRSVEGRRERVKEKDWQDSFYRDKNDSRLSLSRELTGSKNIG
jgi:hypothetical protein